MVYVISKIEEEKIMAEKFTKEGLKILAIKLDQALWEFVYAATWLGDLEGPAGALAANQMRLDLAEKYGSKKEVADIQNALASTYYTIATAKKAKREKEEAGRQFAKALEFSDKSMNLIGGFLKMSPGALAVRGSILYQLGYHEPSAQCFQEALKHRGFGWDARAVLEKDLARTLTALGQKDAAERHFKKALRLVGNAKDKTAVRVFKEYAIFLAGQGKKKEAEKYLSRARKIAQELGLGHQELTINAIKT